MPKKSVYVAGPMTGYVDFNFPAFLKVADELRAAGWRVINPAQHDLDSGTVYCDPGSGTYSTTPTFDLTATLLWDLEQVAKSDAIYLLDGWEASKGATAEYSLAVALGKQVIKQTEYPKSPEYTGEVRTTSASGGQKGSKEQRYDLIPTEPLRLLATLYGRGAEKYDDNNWRKGYDWKFSYAALQRHVNQFWAGEDIDEEMQLPHVISAAWHCFTLAQFMIDHPEYDSRTQRADVG